MGRRQKPLDEKIRQGNPGKRPLPDIDDVRGKEMSLRSPAWLSLSIEAKKIWDRIVDRLSVKGLYEDLDEQAFGRYCTLCAYWIAATNQLNDLESLIKTTTSRHVTMERVSPLILLALRLDNALKDHEKNFGMNPSARQSIELAQYRGGGENKELPFGNTAEANTSASRLPVGNLNPSRLN